METDMEVIVDSEYDIHLVFRSKKKAIKYAKTELGNSSTYKMAAMYYSDKPMTVFVRCAEGVQETDKYSLRSPSPTFFNEMCSFLVCIKQEKHTLLWHLLAVNVDHSCKGLSCC